MCCGPSWNVRAPTRTRSTTSYFGCVSQIGAQTGNVARTAWLSAGLPQHVPGTTIDRQCGSSQQAVHFAAQAVGSGAADLVVAGGVEVMSLVPIASPMFVGRTGGMGSPFAGDGWREHFGDQEVVAVPWRRADRREVGRLPRGHGTVRAHQPPAGAPATQAGGAFDEEITPAFGLAADEGPRADTTLEKMAGLKTLTEDGRLTAAVASQISDGAAALLIASADAVRRHGPTPLARVHTMAVVGSDPIHMLTGPIPATEKVLDKAGLSMDDIDWSRSTRPSPPSSSPGRRRSAPTGAGQRPRRGDRARPSARRHGRPPDDHARSTGCAGPADRYGLQTMCEGGGMANATVLELL